MEHGRFEENFSENLQSSIFSIGNLTILKFHLTSRKVNVENMEIAIRWFPETLLRRKIIGIGLPRDGTIKLVENPFLWSLDCRNSVAAKSMQELRSLSSCLIATMRKVWASCQHLSTGYITGLSTRTSDGANFSRSRSAGSLRKEKICHDGPPWPL